MALTTRERRGEARPQRNLAAPVVAIVNMKGGVGKSTTTLMLAEYFASRKEQRVLTIDFDPQANLSASLIGEEGWAAANGSGNTALQYFQPLAHARRGLGGRSRHSGRLPDIDRFIVDGASDIEPGGSVSLLAATPQLGMFERDLVAQLVDRRWTLERIQREIAERLYIGLRLARRDYGLVLIDCPPGISMLAESAIRLADALVIPTIPDYMSRLGLAIFQATARRWTRGARQGFDPLFAVATKVEESWPTHRSELDVLRSDRRLQTFRTSIPQSADIARAALWSPSKRTVEAKYRSSSGIFDRLGLEFDDRIYKPLVGSASLDRA